MVAGVISWVVDPRATLPPKGRLGCPGVLGPKDWAGYGEILRPPVHVTVVVGRLSSALTPPTAAGRRTCLAVLADATGKHVLVVLPMLLACQGYVEDVEMLAARHLLPTIPQSNFLGSRGATTHLALILAKYSTYSAGEWVPTLVTTSVLVNPTLCKMCLRWTVMVRWYQEPPTVFAAEVLQVYS